MAALVEDMVVEASEAVLDADRALAERVVRRDDDVDAEEVAVETEVIKFFALYQPVGSDLRLLCTILKVNSDFERVADCAVNIAQRAKYLPADALRALRDQIARLCAIARQTLRDAIQAYAHENIEIAERILAQDSAMDALYGQFIQGLITRRADSSDALAECLDLMSIAKNLERIADHATNIAEDVIFLLTGKIVRHGAEVTQ